MYSRATDDGGSLTFAVSGKLWHGVLVMFDRETGSLWTQLDGRAIRGGELGRRLEHVPSVFTTWEAWRGAHPDTLVLAKDEDERGQEASYYENYFADPDRLFMEHLADGIGGGIGPKDVVFGVHQGDVALAVSETLLAKERIVNAIVGSRPIAWLYDEATGSARTVDRRLEERVLVLVPIPGESGTSLFRDALSGEIHGTDELEQIRCDRAYWYAWARSHRGSRVLAD